MIKILHFGDFHFTINTRISNSKITSIKSIIRDEIEDCELLFIINSGDLTNEGETAQMEKVISFYDSIIEEKLKNKIILISTFGNHDINHKNLSNENINLLNEIRDNLRKDEENVVISLFPTEHLDEVIQFKDYISDSKVIVEGILYRKSLDIEDFIVEIDEINTGYLSNNPEVSGNLLYPTGILKDNKSENSTNKYKIAVFHHPFQWFDRSKNSSFQKYIEKNYDIAFIGHEHINDINTHFNPKINKGLVKFANKVFNNNSIREESGFSLYTLDLHNNYIKVDNYEWNNRVYTRLDDQIEPIKIKKPTQNKFYRIKEKFKENMLFTDSEIIHKQHGKLTLLETYVSPDFTIEIDDDKTKHINDFNPGLNSKTIIFGKKEYGKTTYLFKKFIDYFNLNYLPIYIDCESIYKIGSIKALNKEIRKIISKQYEESFDYFENSYSGFRVALIDNFELLDIHKKNYEDIMEYISNEFSIIILTSNYDFYIKNSLKLLGDWDKLTLCDVRNKVKEEIVQRWYGLYSDLSELETDKLISQGKKALNAVLTSGLVPFNIKNIYISLQMIDGNVSTVDIGKQTMPSYYEFLFLRQFNRINFTEDEKTIIRDFLGFFSYKLYTRNKEMCDKAELAESYEMMKKKIGITKYSKNIFDFEHVYKLLFKCGILVEDDDSIVKYRYRYIYYYTLSKHVSSFYNVKVTKREMHRVILNAIKRFNIDRNSNLINFFIYHEYALDEVLSAIIKKARKLTNFKKKFSYRLHHKLLGKGAIKDKIYLPYVSHETSAKERRLKQAKENDERLNELNLPAFAIERSGDEVYSNLEERYTMIDLLGNILRVHWGKINPIDKVEMLNEVFNLTESILFDIHKEFKKIEVKMHKEFRPLLLEILQDKNVDKSINADDELVVDNFLRKISRSFIIAINMGVLAQSYSAISYNKLHATIEEFLTHNRDNLDVYSIMFDVFTYRKLNKRKLESFFADNINNAIKTNVITFLLAYYNYTQELSENDKKILRDLNNKYDFNKKTFDSNIKKIISFGP